jgi:glycosyltransferase involved in cell wall biosynthesis
LKRLLLSLQDQETAGLFDYSIVIVDNDKYESARNVVESFVKDSKISIGYFVEPEQNISLTRNRAVDNAKGDFIAFIDDDEFPIREWLLKLYNIFLKYKCAGVLGPVKPHYPDNTPKWLIKSNICERQSHKTGTILNSEQTRTGNVLLDREMFNDGSNRFDRELGRGGGEDCVFFGKMIATGREFVWCDEATAFETVPPERWYRSFWIRKYVQMGGRTGELAREWSLKMRCIYVVKAILSMIIYSLVLPFSILWRQHVFMRYLLKNLYFITWLIGFFWRPIIRFRY